MVKSNFDNLVTQILKENNVAGGVGSVFSPGAGSTGNQFPAQNDSAYAPGDARIPCYLGSKKKKKGKKKLLVQRRNKI